jgi:hypothetical protein
VRLLLLGLQTGKDGGGVRVTHSQKLVAGGLAPDDEEARLGNSEQIGQEGPTGSVGGTLHRRSCHAEGDTHGTHVRVPGIRCIVLGARPSWLGPGNDQLVSRGPGLDANRQEHVRAILDDHRSVGCHLEGVAGLADSAVEDALDDSGREAG